MPATASEPDEPVRTLSMLVSSGDSARARRARSPQRRARSPAWLLVGTTYAEIVKGHGSRSSSIGSRQPSAQRPDSHRQPSAQREQIETREQIEREHSPKEVHIRPSENISVKVQSYVQCDPQDVGAFEPDGGYSDTRECERVSESECYRRETNEFIDDYANRSSPVAIRETHKYYTASPYVKVSSEVQTFISNESLDSHSHTLPEKISSHTLTELTPPEREQRASSPAAKSRSQDLSYAEILALGLRKQAKTHSISTLPTPQVAQVEIMKEIIVECAEKPSLKQQIEPIERKETSNIKPDKQEKPPQRFEKRERPTQTRKTDRSRSRDMPRQRRAPEKRPTKTHDTHVMKKKKTTKKVIEVDDFGDSGDVEQSVDTIPKSVTRPHGFDVPNKEITKKIQHSATVVETVTETFSVESQPSDAINMEAEDKKSKKKQKSKKVKPVEDEIQKALKEIEENSKCKKKKSKQSRDKSKDSNTPIDETCQAIKDGTPVQDNKKKINKSEKYAEHVSLNVKQINLEELSKEQETQDLIVDNVENVIQCTKDDLELESVKIQETSHKFEVYKENDPIPSKGKKKKPKDKQKGIEDNKDALISPEKGIERPVILGKVNLDEKQELKKRKKAKKADAVQEQVQFETSDVVEIEITEDVKVIEPIAPEIPNIVEQVEELQHDLKDLKENQCLDDIINLQTHDSVPDIDDTSEKSSQKVDKVENTKTQKKKKTKKNKIEDNEIEKALKEIELSECSKKKSKEKHTKQKNIDKKILRSENPRIPLKDVTPYSETIIEESLSSKSEVEKDTCHEEKHLVSIDWNALIAEEESVNVPALITDEESVFDLDRQIEQATEVTILQEKDQLIKDEDLSAGANKVDLSLIGDQGVDISSQLMFESKKISKYDKIKDLKQESMTTPSPLGEQNNNDKFFLSETHTEGSVNKVEEITSSEPIPENMETRTIYLITHEEKKLPPIRTVKVFSSKSNSLEDSSSLKETTNFEMGENENDKITDEKSSNIVESLKEPDVISLSSDLNPVDNNKTLTENFLESERILVEENIDMTKHDAVSVLDIESKYEIHENQMESNESYVYENSVKNMQPNEKLIENLIEEAIFGSVQDRKKVVQEKTSSVPYTQLIEETKTYSLEMDMHQLDYDYHQLITDSYKEDHLKEDLNSSDKEIEAEEKRTSSDIDSIQDKLLSQLSHEKIQYNIHPKEHARTSYHEICDAENMFAKTLATQNEEKKKTSPPEKDQPSEDSTLQDELVEIEPVDKKLIDKRVSQDKIEIYDNPLNYDIDIMNVQYKDIRDGEIVFARRSSEKISSSEHQNEDLIDSVDVNSTDNSAQGDRVIAIIEIEPKTEIAIELNKVRITELKPETTVDKCASPRNNIPKEEVLRHNYSEINDAETVLATISLPVQDFNLIKDENIESESLSTCANKTPDVHDYEKVQIFAIEHQTVTINNLKDTASVITNDKFSDVNAALLLSNENLPQPYSKDNKIKSETSLVSDRISTKIQPEEKSLQYSYYEIRDAENTLAKVVCQSTENLKDHDQEYQLHNEKQNADFSTISATASQISEDTDEFKNQTSSLPIASKITVMSKDNSEKLIVDKKVIKSIDILPLQVLPSRYSYHEIRDAENKLAVIISQNNNESEVYPATIQEISKVEDDKQNTLEKRADSLQPIQMPCQTYYGMKAADDALSDNVFKISENKKELPVNYGKTQNTQDQPNNTRKETTELRASDVYVYLNLPRQSYHEIKDAENYFALLKSPVTNDKQAEFIDSPSHQEEKDCQPSASEDNLMDENVNMDSVMAPCEISTTVGAAYEAIDLSETSENIKTIELDVEKQSDQLTDNIYIDDKEPVDKNETENINFTQEIGHSFEVDDLDNKPILIEYGDVNDIEEDVQKEITNLTSNVSDFIQLALSESLEIKPKTLEKTSTIDDKDESLEPQKLDIDLSQVPDTVQHENNLIKKTEVHTCSEKNQEQTKTNTEEPETMPKAISAELTVNSSIKENENTSYVKSDTAIDIFCDSSTVKLLEDKEITIIPKDVSYVVESKNEICIRTDKSPIHSLHDLLPEIDSIPEFKPSFSNTVLFSNLSADAPEFTPSYMYQSLQKTEPKIIPTEKKADNCEITSEPIDKELIGGSKSAQIMYSSVLQAQKEKPEESFGEEDKLIIPEQLKSQTPDAIQTVKELIGEKTKKNKKKKKKEEKEHTSNFSSTIPELEINQAVPEIINVWTKCADDGKSYAEVVAEGLAFENIEKDSPPLAVEATNTSEAESEPIKSTDDIANALEQTSPEESIGSWAQIVGTNRSSPDRLNTKEIHQDPQSLPLIRAPVILVDESNLEAHKPDLAIDAEGFITVERHRRSRSRSRDNRSESTSNILLKEERDKSENRFKALATTIKPEDSETPLSNPSDVEKSILKVHKGRKSRSSKSKEKETQSIVEDVLAASGEDKQKIKKGKKKRLGKSVEKYNIADKVCQKLVPEINKPETSNTKEEIETSAQQEASVEKKKCKKKKKDKFANIVTLATSDVSTHRSQIEDTLATSDVSTHLSHIEDTPSDKRIVEETNLEAEFLTKPIESSISTPESSQTPIKERLFSEAQYWKVDPNILESLPKSSDIKTEEINDESSALLKSTGTGNLHSISIETSNVLENETTSDSQETLPQKMNAETDCLSSETDKNKEKISEEQSLENKMADLQREIEEMLLPENDSSQMNDDIPRELTMASSIDYHNEDLTVDMIPSLASPEPEDDIILDKKVSSMLECISDMEKDQILKIEEDLGTEHISVSMIDSLLEETDNQTIEMLGKNPEAKVHKKENFDTNIQLKNTVQEPLNTTSYIENKPKEVEKLDSKVPTNMDSIITTNNVTNIKSENFWTQKCVIDDAEKVFLAQKTIETKMVSPNILDSDHSNVLDTVSNKHVNIEENFVKEGSFWLDKHIYHDAECQYFLLMANKQKAADLTPVEIDTKDQNDKDRDPSGSSGHSSDNDESREPCGSPFDSNYISMDLPGGICSWKDQSSYLSLETPGDSLIGPWSEDTPRSEVDIREDLLTTSSLEPVALSSPEQEPTEREATPRTAKDDFSNDIESLLEEVRNVQTRLSDLPDESLLAMEEGLKDGVAILVMCEEAANLLETKIMEYKQEEEIQTLLRELIIMKARISKLLTQARQGLNIIQDAKVEMARQTREIEENKEKIMKLDKWLELINNELKGSTLQSDILTEEDIIKYIEVYEKYIREYEEYEVILKSITVISSDESSQSLREKLNAMQRALEETKNLVIIEIERLRHVLLHIKSAPELVEDDISQTDRTIDSTSMPEEVVSPREVKVIKEKETPVLEVNPKAEKVPNSTIETQTGKSLMSEPPSVADKSIICEPDVVETHDVSITCAPPQEVEVQTSEPHSSDDNEVLESIQVRQTISDGHETIEIASRPVVREQKLDEQSLFVDANYRDERLHKDSQLNIIHSLPQAFETVMVEPDETTTEVVVDADGTKRIIVRKVRKTLVTRQQFVHTQQQRSQIFSGEGLPQETFSQVTLREDKGSSSTALDDGGIQHIQYRSHDGQIISGIPGGEVTIQEFTSKPDLIIKMEKDMKPEEILQLAEGQGIPQIQTSSSSVTAVVQQVTKRIVKTKRRIIRRVVIVDGKEHVTEEVIEEPDNVEIFEEQIPRVSINVTEQPGGVQFEEIDDSDDKGDYPPLPPSQPKTDRKSPKDEKPDDHDNSKSPKYVAEMTVGSQPTDMQNLTKAFIIKESEQPLKLEPVLRDTEDTKRIPSEVNVSTTLTTPLLAPQESIITGFETGQHIITEQNSNVSTTIQKVTKKITRTRRRIIKHIQVIDGKEHVTEEVIEEPENVEIIEEEPNIIQNVQQGFKSKKIRVIRQIQIIDGKEHVTEQIIEEPDDDLEQPFGDVDKITTTEMDLKLKRLPQEVNVDQINITEMPASEIYQPTLDSLRDQQEENMNVFKATEVKLNESPMSSVIDASKFLLGSEIEHSTKLEPDPNQVINTCKTTKVEQITQKSFENTLKRSLPLENVQVYTEPFSSVSSPVSPPSAISVQLKEDLTDKMSKVEQITQESLESSFRKSLPLENIQASSEQLTSVSTPVPPQTVISEQSQKVLTGEMSMVEPITQESILERSLSLENIQAPSEPFISVPTPCPAIPEECQGKINMNKSTIIDTIRTTVKSLDPSFDRPSDYKVVQISDSLKPDELTDLHEKSKPDTTTPKKYDVALLLESERKHTDLYDVNTKPEPIKSNIKEPDVSNDSKQTIQYIDISTSISKINPVLGQDPKVSVDVEIEKLESNVPMIIKKEVDVVLPADIKVADKHKEKDKQFDPKNKQILIVSKPISSGIVEVVDIKHEISEPQVSILETLDGTEHILEIDKETDEVKLDTSTIDESSTQEQQFNLSQVDIEILDTTKPVHLKPKTEKYHARLLIDSERQYSDSHNIIDKSIGDTPKDTQNKIDDRKTSKHDLPQSIQTLNISKSIIKADTLLEQPEPKVKIDVETENLESFAPVIVKKEVEVVLSADTKARDECKEPLELIGSQNSKTKSKIIPGTVEENKTLAEKSLSPKHETREPSSEGLPSENDETVIDNIKFDSCFIQPETFVDKTATTIIENVPCVEGKETPVKPLEATKEIKKVSLQTKNYNINTLLDSERQHTEMHDIKFSTSSTEDTKDKILDIKAIDALTQQPEQSLEVSTCIIRTDNLSKLDPKVKLDVKIENIESSESIILKKDIEVVLPSDIKITDEYRVLDVDDKIEKEQTLDPIVLSQINVVKVDEDSSIVPRKSDMIETLDTSSQVTPEETSVIKVEKQPPQQSVEISMSLSKTDISKELDPKLKFNVKIEDIQSKKPIIVNKDVEVALPSDIEITDQEKQVSLDESKQLISEIKSPTPIETTPQEISKASPDVSKTDRKKNKKKKKHKKGSESDSIGPTETDKSLTETDSSSLDHYIQLPSSPAIESPKPTEEVLQTTEIHEIEFESPLDESEMIIEEEGYEPEETSLDPVKSSDKKKKQKKHKQRGVSEVTTYPKLSTTDSDQTSVSTPVEFIETVPEKKTKDKKRKKKTALKSEPEEVPKTAQELQIDTPSPKRGCEIEDSSPKDESYHTMSEVSDISTVKIIEECVQSSPETLQKEVTTTVTYPVPVVEEIPTQDYCIQTSPEISVEAKVDDDKEISRPATVDIIQQTSPTVVSESLAQTSPIEEKEVHTQTLDNVTVVEKVEMSETDMQTSRSATPEPIIFVESTTQVLPYDISVPEEKYSQTSSPVEEIKKESIEQITIETESREMQTSPVPVAQKDEKSTETTIKTVETDIQTIRQENIDQETSTSPIKEKEMTEMSVQTPEIPLTSTFTQSEEPGINEIVLEEINIESLPDYDIPKKEIVTADMSQQTSPRDEEIVQSTPLVAEIDMADVSQQTSPRAILEDSGPKEVEGMTATMLPESLIQDTQKDLISTIVSEDIIRKSKESISEPQEPETEESIPELKPELKQVTIDTSQQTSPRVGDLVTVQEPLQESIHRDIITVDSTQQTSPRVYSEDSISTSTDEPYEVHLRAQISIPRSTSEFIDSERQYEDQHVVGEKQKQKKRKHKRKAESLLAYSPESLSDPITTELSMSVTPTSEDYSIKDSSSIDEGIYQLTSPTTPNQDSTTIIQHRPTYSDVVQRSKSKSPSPSKTVLAPKSIKERLLDTIQKRAQSVSENQRTIPEHAMTVAIYEPSVEKSYDLVVNNKLDEVKNAIQDNDSSRTETTVLVIIETISIWLEEIQFKIQRETVAGNKGIKENERLKILEKHIRHLKEVVEVTDVNEEIITLIETLTHQIQAVNSLSKQSSVKVQKLEAEWIKFLEDTDKLNQRVERVKCDLDNVILSEVPSQQKLETLDRIELENTDNYDAVKKLFRQYRSFVEVNPKRECPILLYSCDDDTKQVENAVYIERDRLMQLTSLAEEYEQTLQDFSQITEVAEALLDGKIIVTNLVHLHEEIQKHRKFFVNLSHCRAILESLEDNLDSETKAKYAALHNSLHDRATLIVDRAASRAQQMTLAASRWTLLEHGMKEEKQWLIVAQQRVPDLSNVTTMDHEQYINLYQSISLDISHHYAKMLRLLSITEGLQNLIICSGLETECSTPLDTLLRLQEEVDSRLTRLTAFKENWFTYDHLIDRIEGWMKTANRELENITPENITTTGNLRRFWELKAQHEVYNNLKNESGIQFEKALEILPVSDEMVQRQFFSNVEDKWQNLATRIEDIHNTAIQNISDRDVSSGEKLNIIEEELRELRASLDCMKSVIRSEDELNLYIERLQVMTSRIDRILNELSRLSLLPTAESERLGALLTQSGILDDQISEELERSLLLKEKIVQVQTGIIRCQKSQRRARLTLEECEAAERLGSDVVERASDTCYKLLEDLSSQWHDILALRQSLHTLPTSLRVCVSPTGIEKDISALQETHAELEAACNDLSRRLRAKVQLWRRFERQLEMVQGAVREADYMVELLTVQGQVDYDRLLKATEKLETLSESLTRRSGELVGELRDAAVPLAASTEPAVAAQLKRELDDAAAAYEHTCSNLTQLCDKYHKAVDLWKRYRDAAAAVRAFAEFQEGRLHALRPDDAPATAAACLEQESRVVELRSLAAQVAAETGSRALQADADALARRLQLVAGAVQALADLGEARQLARAKAQHAMQTFCDMKQDLAPVQEDGEIVEDKLIALRDNLIALGKSEADIAPAKAELPDIDRDVSDEHSIVRILELWQAMFRDTFLHYHRLSTALVRSGDAATALRLWHEYLLDLQSFLLGSVPADYENLTEHRRLCRVHRNLLTSQRSVLMNENKEMKNRDLADKFDTLTNLHNETLARIVERQDEVCIRIAAWDDYREINTELLRWLKEMEREKEKLQLRYVHIKRINKVLAKIQNLSDKIPEGRKQTEKLLINLKKVLVFTEEAYGASVRIEYAGIVKRVDNLQASLDTWRDFLSRIIALIGEYESLTSDLHKMYAKTQDEINSYNDEERLSRPQLKKAIDKFTDLRTKIEKTETQIEALSVVQEQLKECLSPQDIRIVNQKLWQLRQQRADLEHQLSIIIHRLQERLEIYTVYESRLTRFSEWLITLESHLESTSHSSEISALDPQDLIRRITSDIQAETAMKKREFEWLTETGTCLIELSKKDEKSYSKNTSKQLKDVEDRWNKVQETGRSRIAKINELLDTISQLEERLTIIRTTLHTTESRLTTSIVLEHLTTRAVDEQFQVLDVIHKSIENESREVGEALNLCMLVFNDPDVLKGNFDLRNLRTGYDIVEKKWKSICDASEQRKGILREVRKSAELANSSLPKVEKKLDSIEKRVEKIETRKQRGEPEDESVSKAVIKDLEALEGDVKQLEDAYSRLASARGVELRGKAADSAARLRAAVRRWQQLRGRVDAAGADIHRQFVAAHGRAVVALAEADVRLTRALHLAPTPLDKVATLKELEGVEQELVECEALVSEADRLSLGAAGGAVDMVAEYHALYEDVCTRLRIARAEVVGEVDSAVQVDTLKWETDAALQVDTLTSKETYRAELASAVREASDSLEALRTALLHQPRDDASGDELANSAKEIAKAGAKPSQTLELAKHLSELLLTECDATEDEAMLKEVESLSLRYEDLLAQAKKRELQINNLRLPHTASYALTCEHESGRLTCPLCSERNWKQLDNDLWRLEQWLQFAEATDAARTDPPEQYDALEDAIQDHREFLLDLDSHKSIVVSLNVVGSHVAAHAADARAADRILARLAAANKRWDDACTTAGAWQGRLQHALVHNTQFHDIVVELVARLSNAERGVRSREPLRLSRPPEALQRDFRRFSELRDELAAAEPRVLALHDAAQLLRTGDAPPHSSDICRRLGELRLRLQSLRKLSAVYALKLGAALARRPASATASALAAAAAAAAPQLMEEEEDQMSSMAFPPLDESDVVMSEESEEQELGRLQRGLRFVSRVARASLPFQALLLLLLGAAALAPHAHSGCRDAGPGFEPVLRYPDGPPPL